MTGIVFAKMPYLVAVNLSYNICIQKFFTLVQNLKQFYHQVSRRCAPAENVRKLSCKNSIRCAREKRYFWYLTVCCEMDFLTFIDSPDYSFFVEENVDTEILIISNQPNVGFLPILTHESFPILKKYLVENTLLFKISKKNFEKLYMLEKLEMIRNGIEVIKSDTFEDLVSLKFITIGIY